MVYIQPKALHTLEMALSESHARLQRRVRADAWPRIPARHDRHPGNLWPLVRFAAFTGARWEKGHDNEQQDCFRDEKSEA